MRRVLPVLLLSLLVVPTCTLAQTAPKPEPQTQLEAFLSKRGQLIVKRFHDLGYTGGSSAFATTAQVHAVIFYEPGKPAQRMRGVKIEVKQIGRPAREHSSFLDMDEIEALIQALDYMLKALGEWAGQQKDYTEMIFRTRGDFRAGFWVDGGKIQPFLSSGTIGTVSAYLDPEHVKFFRGQLESALKYLKAN